MLTQFAIFGLEKMKTPTTAEKNSGQPYFFRKYPQEYESFANAQLELGLIMEKESPFIHYSFTEYVILEVFSAAK
jgi:hypothetical protein